jgi:hypothetical protein
MKKVKKKKYKEKIMVARIPAKMNATIVPLENPLPTTDVGEVWRGSDGSVLRNII